MRQAEKTLTPLVAAIMAIDTKSIHYRVQVNPTEAEELARNCGAYNGFTSADLTRMIQKINAEMPVTQFGGDNPNNGSPLHHYEQGNECSRCIYIHVRGFYNREFFADTDLAAELIQAVEFHARKANADEISHEVTPCALRADVVDLKFRIWFD